MQNNGRIPISHPGVTTAKVIGDGVMAGRTLEFMTKAKMLKDAGNGRLTETIGQGISTAFPDAEIMFANARQNLSLVTRGAALLSGTAVAIYRFFNPAQSREGIEGN